MLFGNGLRSNYVVNTDVINVINEESHKRIGVIEKQFLSNKRAMSVHPMHLSIVIDD